jgi:hypothetical protein
MNWRAMDIEALKRMYEIESYRLQQKILQGTAWKKIAGQYKKVSEMSSAIYRRLNPSTSPQPAEGSPGR